MQMKFLSLVSTGALFGALGMEPQAAFAAFAACPGITGQERTSAVLSDVQAGTGGAPNVYNFKVCNTSGFGEGETQFLLRDWELPYDATPGAIANIFAPEGWGWAIETIGQTNFTTGWDGAVPTWKDPSDPFYDPRYQNLDQVIHFFTCGANSCYGFDGNVFGDPLRAGEELEGFGFASPFGPTAAPYQASWVLQPPRSGDPDFPLVGANTPGLAPLAVPEPGGLALFAAALGAMMAARVRRRESSED